MPAGGCMLKATSRRLPHFKYCVKSKQVVVSGYETRACFFDRPAGAAVGVYRRYGSRALSRAAWRSWRRVPAPVALPNGRPRLKKVVAWVGHACQQVRHLLPKRWRYLGIFLSFSILRRGLRQAGYSWKQTRRSLKHQRDPDTFAACHQQLVALHQAEQRGELAGYYANEVRFSRPAPVPDAWQLRGQPPVGRPRGARAATRS